MKRPFLSNYIYIVIFFCLILLWGSGKAQGCELVIVRDENIQPVNAILDEFTDGVSCRTKYIDAQLMPSSSEFQRAIRAVDPVLIFAVGVKATALAAGIDDVPILYVAVDAAQFAFLKGKRNLHAIRLEVSLSKQLSIIAKTLPSMRRIGVIYNPHVSGKMIAEAAGMSSAYDMTLVARKIERPGDIMSALDSLKGKIDALLLVADRTVVTPEGMQLVGLFSLENKVPVIAFAQKYLREGAAVSISTTPGEVGKKAAKLARRVIAGEEIGREYDVDSPVVSFNHSVIHQLNIKEMERAR